MSTPLTLPPTGLRRLLLAFVVIVACCRGFTAFSRQESPANRPTPSRLTSADRGDPFLAAHREAVARNTSEIQFSIALHGGSSRFRPGERIALDVRHDGPAFVAYSSEWSFRYVLDHYDGVESPRIGEWQAGRLPDRYSGGRTTNQVRALTVNLNNVFRFTAPGHYRMFAYSLAQIYAGRAVDPPVSNILEFEILPRDAEWEVTTARDTSDPAVLRYLGTNEAALRLAKALDVDGLFCVRDRAFALRAIERELDVRGIPDSGLFVRQLAELAVLARHPEGPPYPLDEYPRLVADYSAKRARGLAREPGRLEEALKAEIREAAKFDEFVRGGSLIAAVDRYPATAATIFRGLSAKEQRNLLFAAPFWLRTPVLRPLLLEAATSPAENDSQVRDLGLRRLYESAPSVARPLILAELRRSPLRVSAETVGLLPERTIRSLDQLLVEQLRTVEGSASHDDEPLAYQWHKEPATNVARLVRRYATPGVAADVVAIGRARKPALPCRAQSALLAYLQAAKPAQAVSLLEQAVADRSDTGCWWPLEEAAEFGFSPGVEQRVIRYLDDADPSLVESAACALRFAGSGAAKVPLLRRFAAWNAQWKVRKVDLDEYRGEEARQQLDVEHELALALEEGRAWYVDRATIRSFCVSSSCQSDFSTRAPSLTQKMLDGVQDPAFRNHRISIYRPYGGEWQLAVDGVDDLTVERAKTRLLLYPRGTAFYWDKGSDGDEVVPVATRERVRLELMAFIEKHGMSLKGGSGLEPRRAFGWGPSW
jgi:hypothetical protein